MLLAVDIGNTNIVFGGFVEDKLTFVARIATNATKPNASVSILPPTASQAPSAKGSKNVAVMGPEATPPASNAMAVYIGGTKKVIIKENT